METYEYLQTLPDKKSRDEHMKLVEADIKREYTPRMKKLTYAQGKLLIKLVYRETSSSSYQLIQAFLGSVRAGFYQTFAWIFGASLKKNTSPMVWIGSPNGWCCKWSRASCSGVLKGLPLPNRV